MNKLSISVVTYNNQDEILNLMESIYQSSKSLDIKVFMIDNASTDDTVKLVENNYKNVKILPQLINKGFGKAHNRVLKLIDSDYHLVINPDIRFGEGVLKELVEYLEKNDDVALVTPKVVFKDGTEQHLPKINPNVKYLVAGRVGRFKSKEPFLRWRNHYTKADQTLAEPTPIEFCTGCFMLFKTKVFKALKGFDDRYFMYFEDADISRRAQKFGKVIFYPGVSVVHSWGRTSAKNVKYFLIHLNSALKYFAKWQFKSPQ